MCSTGQQGLPVGFPFGLKVPNPGVQFSPTSLTGAGQTVPPGFTMLDFQRAQLFDYTARLQYAASLRGYHPTPAFHHPYHPHGADALAFLYGKHDPRARFVHEEPKPSHSYIGLIAMAILSSPDKKLVLSDIYQWILDNYPYFRNRGPGWRNSIRHNLSLNDCFVKSGRSANGKGHYWAIHPANVDDFKKGDFRRRRAQRRVRKHMGLAVPDEDDSPSPSPSPSIQEWQERNLSTIDFGNNSDGGSGGSPASSSSCSPVMSNSPNTALPVKKRMFDMDSLLAPDDNDHARARDDNSKKLRLIADFEKDSHTALTLNITSSPVREQISSELSPEYQSAVRRSAFHLTGAGWKNVKIPASQSAMMISPSKSPLFEIPRSVPTEQSGAGMAQSWPAEPFSVKNNAEDSN